MSVISNVEKSQHSSLAPPSRKRKYTPDDTTLHSLDAILCTFTIGSGPLASGQNATVRKFHGLLAISRSQLPLSFLDASGCPNKSFAAHLPALEGEDGDNGRLLVVHEELASSRPLYVVESMRSRVYVLCKLAEWVRLDHFKGTNLLVSSKRQEIDQGGPTIKSKKNQDGAWWKSCLAIEADEPALPTLPPRKAPRLSMTRPVYVNQQTVNDTQRLKVNEHDHIEEPVLEIDTEVKTPGDVFAEFITQYLHTLYQARTSLAFFAKGPVSRARAAFTSNDLCITDLTAFLRAMIQSASTADKKYRDKLPDMLKQLPVAAVGAEEDDKSPSKDQKKKKRKTKRLKPDKHGILPDEDDSFHKWWLGDDALVAPADESAEQALKRRSVHLRTRETFMQLILILEVLSLETSPEFKDAESQQQQQQPTEDNGQKTKKKPKKPESLSVLLEVLLDKLSIWSLASGSILDDSDLNTTKDKTPDELRNFCVEVIIPFYLSRAPSHAATVNKKLGGPSSSTTSKPPKPSNRSKPGEPEQRQPPEKKARKPLHRVATESAANAASSLSGPPSLRHSTTDPQSFSDKIKREASETPSLSAIPTFHRDSQTPGASRSRRSSGVQGLRLREVDLSARAAEQEAKKKKKAEIDAKVRDAISTIKRPNRIAANKEIADVAEQRRIMADARARGGVRGTRGKADDRDSNREQVHVTATPSHGHRTLDFVAATPLHPQPSFVQRPSYSQGMLPSSGPGLIPASTMKPLLPAFPQRELQQSASQPAPGYEYQAVEEDITVPATGRRQRTVRYELTPSKKATSTSFSIANTATIDDSPVLARTTSKLNLPMSFIHEEDSGDEENELPVSAHARLFQTPSKPLRRASLVEGSPSNRSTRNDRDDRRRSGGQGFARPAIPMSMSTPVKAAA